MLVGPGAAQPYSAAALAAWRQGHFLNFNGLDQAGVHLWPFATVPFLVVGRRVGIADAPGPAFLDAVEGTES